MSDKLIVPRDSKTEGTISFLLGQMADVRRLLLEQIEGLTQEELDFSPDINKFETIGTLLFHIADVENSWMFEFVDGQELDFEEWKYAFPLRQKLDPRQKTGKSLAYYLEILEKTRAAVVQRVRQFSSEEATRMFFHPAQQASYSLEWVLHHNQQHESHHIGQINLLKRWYRLNEK